MPIRIPGSFNINTQTAASTEAHKISSPPMATSNLTLLDIDPSLIMLDSAAEKILSSINMEALTSLGAGGAKLLTTPPERTDTPTPTGEAISAIGGGAPQQSSPPEAVAPPSPSPGPPGATSSPYMRPQRPFMRLPHIGPRFRPRAAPHFEQAPYRTRGPMTGSPGRFAFNARPPPRMDRGGYRPRW